MRLPCLLLAALLLTAAACGGGNAAETVAAPPPVATATALLAPVTPAATIATGTTTAATPGADYGYTHHRADGNRVAAGQGALPDVPPLDIPLGGPPLWVVAAPAGEATVWAVVLQDGTTAAFRVDGREVTALPTSPATYPAEPPVLHLDSGTATFVLPNAPRSVAPPAILGDGRLAYSDPDGDVVIQDGAGNELGRAAVAALPDGRLLRDEQARLLVLSQPTTRYAHGVLGDETEAAGVTLLATEAGATIVATISVPAPAVIEGISPLWADLDGDGRREIIVTESDVAGGARIVVYDEGGERIAEGPAIGQGFRWRHQLAVAPFGPNGETELVDVLTPHLGGVVEFFRRRGDRLEVVASVPGYTSHPIGTRNLDMALAGDFDGDGRLELLLPTQDRATLGAIRRTESGAEVAWQAPVGGTVVTNLAAATTANGDLAVGVGRDDGVLRLWAP